MLVKGTILNEKNQSIANEFSELVDRSIPKFVLNVLIENGLISKTQSRELNVFLQTELVVKLWVMVTKKFDTSKKEEEFLEQLEEGFDSRKYPEQRDSNALQRKICEQILDDVLRKEYPTVFGSKSIEEDTKKLILYSLFVAIQIQRGYPSLDIIFYEDEFNPKLHEIQGTYFEIEECTVPGLKEANVVYCKAKVRVDIIGAVQKKSK